MKTITLVGKYAVGKNRVALVDDDTYQDLVQFAWKAKPNGPGNHTYAVRNVRVPDGRLVTVRMHRQVLGYSGLLDVDHINRNALDNRRVNLRIVSRSVNARNRGRWVASRTCPTCGAITQAVFATSDDRMSQCQVCRSQCERKPMLSLICSHCSCAFESHHGSALYCSESCRKKSKRKRQIASSNLPPSQQAEIAAARSKAWRVHRG